MSVSMRHTGPVVTWCHTGPAKRVLMPEQLQIDWSLFGARAVCAWVDVPVQAALSADICADGEAPTLRHTSCTVHLCLAFHLLAT